MALSLVQFTKADGTRGVAALDRGESRTVPGVGSVLDLARRALAAGQDLAGAVAAAGPGEPLDLAGVSLLPPIDHEDPAHLLLTGTGLTHLGSAEGRDKMHRAAAADPAPTDSMTMFRMGVEGGKPAPGQPGVQPEWFYKGDGSALVGPGAPLVSPAFALDGGEEPEIAGIYLIDGDGTPVRLGFALANEFSDHVTERGNYLWLAHSKLRPAAVGPELRVGALPADVRGTSRILRDGAVLWERPFVSGEANMSHSIANLEHHHFKYPGHRRPGDVHVHFFGTATLSFSEGVATRPGDVFEIEAEPFALPLRNPLALAPAAEVSVRGL
ncbi:AraD1 family protein [Methylobacterium sp. J-076]|uniref:AraD1 family protein n=1 Tax=Methylobacterium sp. J-076 TaxID=2836655 RepID=UPI001FB9530F|nr:AraD1 family protein [Methylobacterium sp. J-076]MCJ2012278.1 FAH family protein [Methylobacterium sp. J-076]